MNILYAGMAEDIISPMVLAPDFTTLYVIDKMDMAYSESGSWDNMKKDILAVLSKGSDRGSFHDTVMLKYNPDRKPISLISPISGISASESLNKKVWTVSFTWQDKQRTMIYYHHRNFSTEPWPTEITNINHIMCMGATFPIEELDLQDMLRTRCLKDCRYHALTFLHEVFSSNLCPLGRESSLETRNPTSSAPVSWVLNNYQPSEPSEPSEDIKEAVN